jgi:hypothetical protein
MQNGAEDGDGGRRCVDVERDGEVGLRGRGGCGGEREGWCGLSVWGVG